MRAGVLSLAATLAIAVFAGVVRVAGGAVAGFARADAGAAVEAGLAESIATKILGFRDGLNAIVVGAGFWRGAALSLAMWGMIGDGLSADGACVCAYAGVGWADVLADDAADGGEYRRVVAAVADHWVVYADCGDGCGDA